jgi:hypothetical protein
MLVVLTSSTPPRLYRVVMDLDAETVVASEQHQADLIREFQLISHAASDGEPAAELPGRLADLILETLADYTPVQNENLERSHAALARGDKDVHLEMDLPAEAIPAIEKILGALEEADAYCREGALLTLATPPHIADVRRWVVEEVTRQIRAAEADSGD